MKRYKENDTQKKYISERERGERARELERVKLRNETRAQRKDYEKVWNFKLQLHQSHFGNFFPCWKSDFK